MEQNHIIHKLVLDVSVKNERKAHEIKDNISSFLSIDVFPKLEAYLDTLKTMNPNTTILRVSKLQLDIDESHTSLNNTLKNKILELFKEELSKKMELALQKTDNVKEDLKVNLLTEDEGLLKTFIYFLEKGYMPWWNSNQSPISILEPDVFKKIIALNTFSASIAYSIQNQGVRERIINQLTDAQIVQTCQEISKAKGFSMILKNTVVNQLVKQSLADRKTIWSLILNIIAIAAINPESITEDFIKEQVFKTLALSKEEVFKTLALSKEEVSKILASSKEEENETLSQQVLETIIKIFPSVYLNNKPGIKKNKKAGISNQITNVKNTEEIQDIQLQSDPKDKKQLLKKLSAKNAKQSIPSLLNTDANTEKIVSLKDSYHVLNAGLVLIHPFINNFFKRCNLIDPDTKKLIDPEVCIHLLHYIATGKTNQPESNMLFEKFLCNIPLQQSINRHIKLSRKHKAEAAKLIAAIQQNWSSMRNSSVALLQNEFFQRPGKLTFGDNYTITIERKTQDILMDKLSWGLGFIKLPWQNQFIYVNW